MCDESKRDQEHQQNQLRFAALEQRQDAFAVELAANTKATQDGNADINAILGILQGGRKGIRMGLTLGKGLSVLAKFLQPLVWLALAAWAVLHGHWPHPGE